MANSKTRLAVLISGNGSNLQSIISQIELGQLDAEIVCVISNNADAYGLKRAKKHNLSFHAIEDCDYNLKVEFEKTLIETLGLYQVDLIILAGFMRILSAEFVAHYPDQILNIHPSLLPKYKGLNTHERVLAAGDSYHGATVHLVTEELDSGKILIQDSCRIDANDDEKSLQQKIQKIEHVIYPQAIREYAQEIRD